MDQILKGIPNTSCILDDMIITGKTDEEHLHTLQLVLQRLHDYNLRANLEKCSFFQKEITYCGHIIDAEGLHKTPEKVDAMLKAPRPESLIQLRAFLGLVNYYGKFIPNLASVVQPLNQLLRKDVRFKWSKAQDSAFVKIKKLITSDTVLTHYNPDLPIRLACDASAYGLGCVLSHVMETGEERPIAFASRSLNAAETNYAQIHKEALSIIWAVRKFHCYLYGKLFVLVTDHQPLLTIFGPKKGIPATTAARLQRYAIELQGYDYSIEYKSSTANANADGLSRLPCPEHTTASETDPVELFNVSQIENLPVTAMEIARETRRDPILSNVLELTQNSWKGKPNNSTLNAFYTRRNELSVHQGCLMWGIRVIIPPKLRSKVLSELHEGHVGIVKMKALSRSYFWWPGLDNEIEQLAKRCSGCQVNQNEPTKAALHPWEWPSAPWERIHIDFAGPFMGYMYLILVDAHSKWPEIQVMKRTTAGNTVEVLRTIFGRTGLPKQIVSDNGSQFTSELFREFTKINGIRHKTSAPWHPATNGQAERFVQTFKMAMKSATTDGGSIYKKIANFLLAYRNTPNATTKETPAKLFLGRHLRTRLDLIKPSVQDTVQNAQFAALGDNKNRQFNVGENVMVRDYRDGSNKWTNATISEKTGPLSYNVETSENGTWRHHADQITKTGVETQYPEIVPEISQERETTTGITISDNSVPQVPVVSERRYPRRNRKAPDRLTYD